MKLPMNEIGIELQISKIMNKNLKAPFPYFGGKGLIADIVWKYLGDVKQYIEPFFGSGAVLLKRPPTKHTKFYEIVCDKDGFVCNVWRAIQFDPDETAKWCDWPINHADLIARRKSLLENEERLLENLCEDPEWFDAKMAGYWIWCASSWIGSGMLCPNQIPHLIRGTGIHSKRPHLIRDTGIHSKRPHLTHDKGIHSEIPHLTHDKGICTGNAAQWLNWLSARLRNVKVVCGDWTRVCGGNWQASNKPVGIFFDPPYATDMRDKEIYHKESLDVAKDVGDWALKRGDNPDYRIVVCGYEGEHQQLIDNGWFVHEWSTGGGYSRKNTKGATNRHLERLFISPYCEKENTLFEKAFLTMAKVK